jgi:integrase
MRKNADGCSSDGGGYEPSDKFTSSEAHIPCGSEDGDNSLSQGNRNETDQNTQAGALGDGSVSSFDVDERLNIEKILARFDELSGPRYRGRTPETYKLWFRGFAKKVKLEDYSRQQLATRKGKELVLNYLKTLPPRSLRSKNAGIKAVWKRGIGIPYPVEPNEDMPRPPKTMRRSVPPDKIVKEWAEILDMEKDPYYRLLWSLEANYGWRPSHICKLKWRNVEFDETGKPISIIGDGAKEQYKTNSAIIATVFPSVSEALLAIREMPEYDSSPEKSILPFRYVSGKFTGAGRVIRNMPVEQSSIQLYDQWCRLQRKRNLPKLRMCDLRHWVSKTCNRIGMDRQAICCLMGHDPEANKDMQVWYSMMSIEEILDEQKMRLPDGPLRNLAPDVQMIYELPKEVVDLWTRFRTGQIGTLDFLGEAETLRKRQIQKSVQIEQ